MENPIEHVKQNFPGWRYVTTAPVEPFQYFVRGDGAGVQQALRASPVIGKERMIVVRDTPVPEPLDDTPIEVDEVPNTEPIDDGALESPDADEEFLDEEFLDEEEEDIDVSEPFEAELPPPTPAPTTTNTMNVKNAVKAAFATFTNALSKALKTVNISLNLAENNKDLSTITADGVVAAQFRIQRFPGSNPLLIVSKFAITEQFRNSGLNRALHQVLEEAADQAGAAGILATVREDNQLQNVILEFTGWTPIQSFVNPETGAGVQLYYKEVGS
jgi:hypothetical protein